MLLNSLLNTDNAAQLYAQYRLCCSTLCSIPTMLLNSLLFALYRQATLLLNHAEILDIITYWKFVFLFLQVNHEEQTTSAGFVDQPEPATESSSPDPDIEIMSKNSSSTSQHVKTPAAAWILVLLLSLQMLQNNSANSVVAEIFQLYLHQACVTKKRNKPYSRTIMIFCMTMAGYSTRAYRFL